MLKERGLQQMCQIRRIINLYIMEIKLHLLRINLKRFLRSLFRNYFNKYKFYSISLYIINLGFNR